MKCEKCKVTFDAARKPVASPLEFDCVEVKVICPNCGDAYYAIADRWAREASLDKLIEDHRKKGVR
jgi:hypothetical protein